MRFMKRIIPAVLLLVIFSAFVSLNDWQPVEGSAAHFKIRGLFGIYVKGTLSGMKARIRFDENAPERSLITASVEVATIRTGNRKRDKHLNSDDFFDAQKYPLITFRSFEVSRQGSVFLARGLLNIKDVTDTVNIPFTVEHINNNRMFHGAFEIDRLRYGVGRKMPGMGRKVKVKLDVFAEPLAAGEEPQ